MTRAKGLELAGYRLLDRLGEGGMGDVWRAQRLEDGQEFALKFLREPDAASAARLVREARAAQTVQHPNVVTVHEVLEHDDQPVLVLELLRGETLAERLSRSKPLPVDTTAEIISGVVAAVGAAHAAGVVHRDLKPSNVFLTEAGVRVVDFGIAKRLAEDQEDTQLTQSGALIGTPCYMAPEQAFGEAHIDDRADVWALGIILYECLSGLLPTRADNVGQVLKVILTRKIWPLEDAAPDVPDDLAAVVDRMLEQAREERPALREVADVLAAYTDAPAPAFGPSTVRRKDEPEVPPEPPPAVEPPPRESEDAGPSAKPLLIAVVGLLVSVGVIWSLLEPPSRSPAATVGPPATTDSAPSPPPVASATSAPSPSTPPPVAPRPSTTLPSTPSAPRPPPAPARPANSFDPLRQRR